VIGRLVVVEVVEEALRSHGDHILAVLIATDCNPVGESLIKKRLTELLAV